MRLAVYLANVTASIGLGLASFVIAYQLNVVPASHFIGQSSDSGCTAFSFVQRLGGWRCAALDPATSDPLPSIASLVVVILAVAWLSRGPAHVSPVTLGLVAVLALHVTLALQLGPVLKGDARPQLSSLAITISFLCMAVVDLLRRWRQ